MSNAPLELPDDQPQEPLSPTELSSAAATPVGKEPKTKDRRKEEDPAGEDLEGNNDPGSPTTKTRKRKTDKSLAADGSTTEKKKKKKGQKEQQVEQKP